jgi:hypothetical protein
VGYAQLLQGDSLAEYHSPVRPLSDIGGVITVHFFLLEST